MQVVPRLTVERMRHDDIATVHQIEREIFLSPWPRNAYASELSQNRQAFYLVLRQGGVIIGYAGVWRVAHEAHVTTIGVRASDQRHGYGTALFAALILRAYEMGARWVTLEVRASNLHAMQLYERFGFKQIALHAAHGGVVPELAAREHLQAIAPVVDAAMRPLAGGWDDLDAVTVTRGPGLVGCLLIGALYAQAVATARRLPICGVSHLAGHVYSAWLAEPGLEPPFLALVVSGGHTECIELVAHGEAVRLASTRDDAAGEAFDKVARLLGLPYPGGPAIQGAAVDGDAGRFPLPRTRLGNAFSFSGLKTAVRYTIRDLPAAELDGHGVPGSAETVSALAASFQHTAV